MKKGKNSSKKLRAALSYLFARLLLLPLLFVWLELVLHAALGMQLRYCVIYILHGLMYGSFFSGICSLLPKKAANLLVAGRCISSTHEAQASYRVMPIVTTLGQAAGTAAAVAVKAGVGVKEIDVKALQEILVRNGAFIGI